MNMELFFSVAGVLAMIGWLLLLFSPFIPKQSDDFAGKVIPAILSVGYVVLILFFMPDTEGGFGSLNEVLLLFSFEGAMLALWVHVLIFDLFIGAWICRTARREEINYWLVLPCLPLTFLFGPAGFLVFLLLRFGVRTRANPVNMGPAANV